MISNKKISYSLLVILFAVFIFTGCKKDEGFKHANGAAMTIEDFTAKQGGGGTVVLITGSNFTTDTTQIAVTINGKKLAVVGANENQVMAVVPKKCGSGNIVVKVGADSAVSTGIFNYVFTRTVTTLAGNGTAGFANGEGVDAMFKFHDYRCGLTVDDNLNVYVADAGNHCIRKITPDGVVSTLAGSPEGAGYSDGTGSGAKFQTPFDVAVDAAGNVYSVDPWNWDIRKITPDGTATTIGWSIGSGPFCIGIDKLNGNIYYTAHDAGKINRILPDGTNATIIEGLAWPADITVDKDHNLFIVLHDIAQIGKFTADTWTQTIIAGQENVYGYKNGPGTTAQFSSPWSIGINSDGGLYIAGNGNQGGDPNNPDQSIRYITPGTWNVSTFSGSGTSGYAEGIGDAAAFNAPTGVAVDKNGTVYVLDRNNNRIRKIVSE